MIREQHLPPVRDLMRLSRLVSGYPATRDEIEETAMREGFNREMIVFLEDFPLNRVFNGPADFTTQCELLEMIINQERQTPQEVLHSAQD